MPRGCVFSNQRCVFSSRGLNRSAVGKTAIWARGRPQPLARPALTSLVACASARRRAILRQGDAGWRLRSAPSLRGGLAHRLACAPYPSIQSTYSKGRASRGFVLRGCIRKAGGARCEAALRHGLADTRFFRRRTRSMGVSRIERELSGANEAIRRGPGNPPSGRRSSPLNWAKIEVC